MDDLSNLLAKRAPQEPPELAAIKTYIQDRLKSQSKVALRGESIIVTVTSASLANTLRFHAQKIKAAANTDRQLIFRIG